MNEQLVEIWSEQEGNASFAIWDERSTISDCLQMLNLKSMASKALDPKTPKATIDKFLNIIETEAKISKRHDVLEILSFAGLIYG